MGSSYSTPDEKTITTDKVENVKRLFNVDDNDDFLETLNMSDFKINDNKLPLPIIGGNDFSFQNDEQDLANIDFNLVGGSQNNDIRFMAKRRRYLKHNVFKILSQLDGANKSQKGGNQDEDEKYLSTSSDDEAIKHIKNIILKEVNKLNLDSNNQLGGDCGCDGNKGANVETDNDQHGGAKKKSKKAKKSKKVAKKNKVSKKSQKGGDRKRKQDKQVDSTDSSSSSSSSSSDDSEESYNSKNKSTLNQSESSLDTKKRNATETETETEDESESEHSEESDESSEDNSNEQSSEKSSEGSQKGGLSIFPFNSSEIKASASEKKNMRMIRRKI